MGSIDFAILNKVSNLYLALYGEMFIILQCAFGLKQYNLNRTIQRKTIETRIDTLLQVYPFIFRSSYFHLNLFYDCEKCVTVLLWKPQKFMNACNSCCKFFLVTKWDKQFHWNFAMYSHFSVYPYQLKELKAVVC